MTSALCFKCGAEKKDPVSLCSKCMAAPQQFEDVVLSYCLSLECVKPGALEKCRDYFNKKKKPPRFREVIVDAAIRLAGKLIDRGDQSIEFSSAMFNFTDLKDEDDEVVRRRSVTVNIIGRRKGQGDDEPSAGMGSRVKTFHSETWLIGQQISEKQVNESLDADQIFVWYRWINDRWNWSCVSRGKFAQLKSVEDGTPF